MRLRRLIVPLAIFAVVPAQATAASPAPVGPEIRVSQPLTTDGNLDETASNAPDVAINTRSGEALVVWSHDAAVGGQVVDEFEIYGQRLAPDGTRVGGPFRISSLGGLGDPDFDAGEPAVAYNPIDDEYLVVWHGDTNTGGLVAGEFEIFAQRLTAAGAEVGPDDQRISQMGGTGSTSDAGLQPDVVHNPVSNEYLVVWQGTTNGGGLAPGEQEIFAQRVSAGGTPTGPDDERVSRMGGTGNSTYLAQHAAVAHDPVDNAYLVVWAGDTNTDGLVDDEFEVFSQRIAADGTPTGAQDVRVSQMGGTGSTAFYAQSPDVAFHPTNGEYVVVWYGTQAVGEAEIFAQRMSRAGAEVGGDREVSVTGSPGDPDADAISPAVTVHPPTGESLVAWRSDDPAAGLADNEFEVFAQRLDATAGRVLATDQRVSTMGGTGSSVYGAFFPAAVHNPRSNEYLVAWLGDTNTGGLVDGEGEIFAQRLEAPPVPVPPADPGPTPAPAPPPAPIAPPAIVPPPPPPAVATPTPKFPAKLAVLRAGVEDGRLDALWEITRRASGELKATFRANGTTYRFTEKIPSDGRIRVDRRLPRRMRRVTTGILEIEYAGNARTRPDAVRLRAARNRARLTRGTTRIDATGTLLVQGTISTRARGVVRVRLGYTKPDGTTGFERVHARIGDGRWKVEERLPPAARAGGQLSIQFTGYLKRRIRGEQIAKQVLP